ncbi:hypothetical protein P170DRAFT_480727 [Aspergillus steynii IBT 23096]|uniref:Fungal N-terminal domain-containing protein n=1 Tax=Aspergillus steynii IBT 23096 TaxID=1392250 RepID=A0A2I2FSZ4_9EURO|nr:uncharacterized protein P170DRAFT_480727 [Aspergillus steynii IBT 23096]PLB43768.1 hypothetical protein P170DRAFT_480727 [Aspergillus steynii IBT 23096]
MCDPVGVISLGISVCQGLLAYYGPYKAFHEEIEDIICRTQNLDRTMRLLEKVLDGAQSSEVTQKAECARVAMRAIENCEQGLKRLRGTLKSCYKTSAGSQSALKKKVQMNRILYPFRRDTLMSMVSMVNGLQNNLNTALQMLTYAMTTVNEEYMGMVVSNAASAASGTNQVLDVVRDMSQAHDSFDGKLESIERRLIKMETSIAQHQMQPAFDPSLLRSLLDSQNDLDEEIGLAQVSPSLWAKSPRKACNCLNGNCELAPAYQILEPIFAGSMAQTI